MIHINFPIKCDSEEEGEKLVAKAKRGNPVDIAGQFVRRMRSATVEVFIFEFTSANRASDAKLSDFVLTIRVTALANILAPRPTTSYVLVDLKLIPQQSILESSEKLSQLASTLTATSKEASTSKEELEEVVKSVTEGIVAVKEAWEAAKVTSLDVGDDADNKLICRQLASAARSKGYIVETNKSTVSNKVSKYFSSRPDLVIYHPTKLQAYTLVTPSPSEEAEEFGEEKELHPRDVTLRGGTAEHKTDGHGSKDVMGQLLGGMEKVGGDMALHYIQSSDNPIFQEIKVYGLLVNLEKQICTAHKLTMDFNTSGSCLESGDEELGLSEGLNRLLQTLA